jgi:hypothetical protein
MNQWGTVFLGLMIPLAGTTTLGAAMVFVLRREMNQNLQKLCWALPRA